ncbi:MAG: transporter, family, tetracycline resistance protein [Patescibacteria group bacterium]|nr:transporter, family, tetracycline resistance protein [Patescibacteria group bacterium]
MEKAKKQLEGRALPIVLFTVFLDVLGIGILIPVLPQLMFTIFIPQGFSYNEALILLGWLTGIYPLMQFLATPILGQLSDRFGRRKVLAVSLAGTALGYALFAVAIVTKNIPLLFIARAFDGVTGGNISVARAVVADVSPPKHRTRNFGFIGACFGLGFVMGPYLGARLAAGGVSFFGLFNTPSWFSTATPFWFTAILSTINVLLLLAFLPETHKHINAKLKLTWNKSLQNIKSAATSPGLRVVFGSSFLYWGGFTFFTTFFQIYLIQKLGFKQSNVGDFFAYIGIWIVISQAVFTPLLLRYKNSTILRFSILGTGFALLATLFPNNTAQLLMVAPFIAIFNGLTIANSTALVSKSVGPEIQGEVLGIDSSIQALAQSVPAIISGYIATLGINVPVLVGASVILTGGIMFNVFYRQPKTVLHQVV